MVTDKEGTTLEDRQFDEFENQFPHGDLEKTDEKKKQKKEKQKSFATGLLTGLVIALCSSCIVYLYNATSYKKPSSADVKSKKEILTPLVKAKIGILENSISQYYLEDYDTDEAAEHIYKGLIEGLGDKYSTYYTAQELEQVRQSTEGVFYGIGASVSIDADTNYAKIVKVLPNTPAEEAGLKDGDIIVEVEGESTAGQDLQTVVTRIKGEENTNVTIKIYREGETDYLEFTITRKPIETTTVNYSMDHRDKTAIIQISEFDTITTEQFEDALKRAKAEGMKGLILDLRDNPGGSLATVVDIARMILPKGLIVYTEDKYGEKDEYTCDGENEIDVPLVVLVNGNSASASEILSGAIKDYGIGTIVGTTTYGKGIVQKIFSLTDGSAVKLTVSHYYTPKGNDIHGVGIEPDETVELDVEKYVEDGTDNQMLRAKQILKKEMK